MRNGFLSVVLLLAVLFSGCGPAQPTSDDRSSADSAQLYLTELNKAISENDQNPDLYNKRAQLFLLEREFDKALKDINRAISLNDKNPEYYLTLSDIQLLMGQTDNCMTALNRASALNPNDQEARLKLAKLYLILHNYAATHRVINELITRDEYNPQAYFLRAIASLETGDTARAVGDLMKAVDQDQQYYDAYMQLGELFSLRKDPLAE
ncbi:MAG: tetratricopeptide repeat protein, partial [Bacteroidota bacterium]